MPGSLQTTLMALVDEQPRTIEELVELGSMGWKSKRGAVRACITNAAVLGYLVIGEDELVRPGPRAREHDPAQETR